MAKSKSISKKQPLSSEQQKMAAELDEELRAAKAAKNPCKLKGVAAVAPESALIDACKNAFGDHPEDIISLIKSTADTLSWLEELFKTIEREALNERNGYRIKHLAEMGAYLAFDIANFAGSEYEKMHDALVDAGIIGAESCPA